MLVLLTSAALAQQARTRHIEAELPPSDPGAHAGAVTAAAAGTETVEVGSPNRSGGGNVARKEKREAVGVPPVALSGRWTVVDITDLGETEDFRHKQERTAMALDADCATFAWVFDFGAPTEPGGLPGVLEVAEQRECTKGGLGLFLNETTFRIQARWTTGPEGQVKLALPELRADVSLVRLRLPEGGDASNPPQWLGPEMRHERVRAEYTVLAEPPPRSKDPSAPPVALHLTSSTGTILHLEPLPARP